MKGWLVCNGALNSGKFTEHTEMLLAAAKKNDVEMELRYSGEIMYTLGGEGVRFFEEVPEFAVFWDKDIRLAYALEGAGVRLFNSAAAIEKCDDKAMTHEVLSAGGVAMPKTITVPLTFEGVGYPDKKFFERAGELLGYPLVVKERFGSFGKQVYLARSFSELCEIVDRRAPRGMILQELVKSSCGRDVRINVVGGECIAAMYREAKDGDFRANVTNGGSMREYMPSEEEKAVAVKCCELLGVDFAGVDILFGENGPLVCEVNSNAHLKNIMTATGVNVADEIYRYIKRVQRDGAK